MYRPRSRLLLLTALVLPFNGFSSPASKEAVRRGAKDLSAKDYAKALEAFDGASKADPADAEAVFFQGVALNRLGRFEEAFARLDRAAGMGATHPDLAFETGWSLVGLKRWKEAVDPLTRYELAKPGRGQTSEFLGRAYLGLDDFDRAEASLKEATRRDPDLKPTVQAYLALVEKRRKGEKADFGDLAALLQESDAPDAPAGEDQKDTTARLKGRVSSGKKPLDVAVSMGFGYKSNVIALGAGDPLPGTVARRGSKFERGTLDVRYSWRLSGGDALAAGYGYTAVFYENIPSSNLEDHVVFLDWRHRLDPDIAFSFRISDQFTQIDGSNFRNQVEYLPSLSVRHAAWATTRLAYAFANRDYYYTTTPVRNRDGDTRTFSVTELLSPSGTRLKARVGYAHQVDRADGPDYASKSHDFHVGIEHPLFLEITSRSSYKRSYETYDHANSQAGAGFAYRRVDMTESLNVQLTRPIGGDKDRELYLQYGLARNESNIEARQYHQYSIGAGIVLRF